MRLATHTLPLVLLVTGGCFDLGRFDYKVTDGGATGDASGPGVDASVSSDAAGTVDAAMPACRVTHVVTLTGGASATAEPAPVAQTSTSAFWSSVVETDGSALLFSYDSKPPPLLVMSTTNLAAASSGAHDVRLSKPDSASAFAVFVRQGANEAEVLVHGLDDGSTGLVLSNSCLNLTGADVAQSGTNWNTIIICDGALEFQTAAAPAPAFIVGAGVTRARFAAALGQALAYVVLSTPGASLSPLRIAEVNLAATQSVTPDAKTLSLTPLDDIAADLDASASEVFVGGVLRTNHTLGTMLFAPALLPAAVVDTMLPVAVGGTVSVATTQFGNLVVYDGPAPQGVLGVRIAADGTAGTPFSIAPDGLHPEIAANPATGPAVVTYQLDPSTGAAARLAELTCP
ncbi:MAG: hypothetical protein ABI321_19135 [Polyangia bacterium]